MLWLVTSAEHSHYLNQCQFIVNWILGNTFQWNLAILELSYREMYLNMSFAKLWAFDWDLNLLNCLRIVNSFHSTMKFWTNDRLCLKVFRNFNHQISSWSCKVWVLTLSYHCEIWQVPQQDCCWETCHISERLEKFKLIFYGFEISQDLV